MTETRQGYATHSGPSLLYFCQFHSYFSNKLTLQFDDVILFSKNWGKIFTWIVCKECRPTFLRLSHVFKGALRWKIFLLVRSLHVSVGRKLKPELSPSVTRRHGRGDRLRRQQDLHSASTKARESRSCLDHRLYLQSKKRKGTYWRLWDRTFSCVQIYRESLCSKCRDNYPCEPVYVEITKS